jgi:hypothetical protein
VRQSRVREQAGHLTRNPSEDHLIGAVSPLYPKLPFKDDGQMVQRFTLSAHDLSRLEAQLLKMLCQPGELPARQVREDLNLAQVVD